MRTTCDVKETISVSIDDIIECEDLDKFLDFIADEAGHPLMTETSYKVVGLVPNDSKTENNIQIEVTGCIDFEEEQDGEKHPPAP